MSTPEVRRPTPEELPILMSGEAGAGDILRACREQRGWTQLDIAQRMGVNRSTVTNWEQGTRWPKGVNLDKLLVMISPGWSGDKRAEARVTMQELIGLTNELELLGKDELDTAHLKIAYAYPKVLNTLILAACGTPGIMLNPQTTRLFFDHRKEVLEEKQRRSLGEARNVTPEQQKYVDRDVYASDPQVVDKPTDNTEPTT